MAGRRPAVRSWFLCALSVLLFAVLMVGTADGKSSGGKGKSKAKKSKKEPATMDFTVPQGARPGDRLEFVSKDDSNQQFYMEVPKGAEPGQQLRMQLPDGVKKARMKKFYPHKRKGSNGKDSRGGKSSKQGSKKPPNKPVPPLVGIDFGSEYIKIALEKERKDGDQLEDPIVLNAQGKRTTPNILALQEDEIFFGDVAVSLLPKLPNSSFVHTKQLLGRPLVEESIWGQGEGAHPSGGVKWFEQMGIHYEFAADPKRGTVRISDGGHGGQQDDSSEKKLGSATATSLSVEELTALTLMKCKELVSARMRSSNRGGSVSHYAIAVPVWFTKLQRMAMSDAARLAGFENVALVNENTALAFKYALSRNPRDILAEKGKNKKAKKTNEDAHTVLLIDVGATGATASLVSIRIGTKTKGRKMSLTETIDIQAVAWEDRVGGRNFDREVAQLLANRYNAAEVARGAIADYAIQTDEAPQAMGRLLREAERTKEKLSANTAVFRQRLTRSTRSTRSRVRPKSRMTVYCATCCGLTQSWGRGVGRRATAAYRSRLAKMFSPNFWRK
eukprot:COSAG05_NODE_2921_length_2509_cov_2.239834_1_plen_559_part_00